MKSQIAAPGASPTLLATILASGAYSVADLYTITLVDGTSLLYTSWDVAITFLGVTYSPGPPLFDRGAIKTTVGVEVDQLQLTMYPGTSQIRGGAYPQFAANGGFDGATVQVMRLFTNPSIGQAALISFTGRVSDVKPARTQIEFQVSSDLELLNITMPRNLFQTNCMNSLYDASCALDRALFSATGTVVGGSSLQVILASGLGQTDGYYNLGSLIFTSGALAGMGRTVKGYVVGQVTLMVPMPAIPANGDTFVIYAGCDKLAATCSAKFNNLQHFRGFPYVPVPETAL